MSSLSPRIPSPVETKTPPEGWNAARLREAEACTFNEVPCRMFFFFFFFLNLYHSFVLRDPGMVLASSNLSRSGNSYKITLHAWAFSDIGTAAIAGLRTHRSVHTTSGRRLHSVKRLANVLCHDLHLSHLKAALDSSNGNRAGE